MDSSGNRLVPLSVPWFVSPSDPGLSLSVDTESTLPIVVELSGVFGTAQGGGRRLPVLGSGAEVGQREDWIPSRYADPHIRFNRHRVRVLFTGGWIHRGNHHEDHPRREGLGAFDWSGVPGLDDWEAGHACPNPSVYEVQGSGLSAGLHSLGLVENSYQRHFLVVGREDHFEILARGWEWQLGPPLP